MHLILLHMCLKRIDRLLSLPSTRKSTREVVSNVKCYGRNCGFVEGWLLKNFLLLVKIGHASFIKPPSCGDDGYSAVRVPASSRRTTTNFSMDDTGWPSKQSKSRAGNTPATIAPVTSSGASAMRPENLSDTRRAWTALNGRRSWSRSVSPIPSVGNLVQPNGCRD